VLRTEDTLLVKLGTASKSMKNENGDNYDHNYGDDDDDNNKYNDNRTR
jgi:hypothetical protein